MNPTIPTKLDIRNEDIIEWYDGVISAVFELGEDRVPHLCLCIAWSPEYEVRVYGLVPIANEVAAKLREALNCSKNGERWYDIVEFMDDAVRNYKGYVSVIATDGIAEKVLGQAVSPFAGVPELELQLGGDRTEATYDEPRLLAWLERLGVPKPLSWREKH